MNLCTCSDVNWIIIVVHYFEVIIWTVHLNKNTFLQVWWKPWTVLSRKSQSENSLIYQWSIGAWYTQAMIWFQTWGNNVGTVQGERAITSRVTHWVWSLLLGARDGDNFVKVFISWHPSITNSEYKILELKPLRQSDHSSNSEGGPTHCTYSKQFVSKWRLW